MSKKINYIVIAGPQSSGKTTAWQYLKDKYDHLADFHSEINQYTLFKNTQLGSIAVTAEMQIKIHQADLSRIKSIMADKVQVVETCLFHLVYYALIIGPDFYQQAWQGDQQAPSRFDLKIIFIDTTPKISFSRRRENYQQRITNEIKLQQLRGKKANEFSRQTMAKYKQRIDEIYPWWKKVYQDIDFAKTKIKIDNNHQSLDKFLAEVDFAFQSFTV